MAGCRSLSAECGVLRRLSTGATLHQQRDEIANRALRKSLECRLDSG